MVDRNFGVQSNKKVDVYLRVKNSQANGLGVPLPAGKIRVAKLDEADKSLEFIGEDLIDHTSRDETVPIKLGSALPPGAPRNQVAYPLATQARGIAEENDANARNHN